MTDNDELERLRRIEEAASAVLRLEYPKPGSEDQPHTPKFVALAWSNLRKALDANRTNM